MISIKEVLEILYRGIMFYLLYKCWCMLEGFVSLAVRIYG